MQTNMHKSSSNSKILKKNMGIILTGILISITSLTITDFHLANAQNHDFAIQFGTSGPDEAIGVATDSSAVYMVGHVNGALPGQTYLGRDDAFIRKYDSDGNVVWTRQFGTSGADVASRVWADL